MKELRSFVMGVVGAIVVCAVLFITGAVGNTPGTSIGQGEYMIVTAGVYNADPNAATATITNALIKATDHIIFGVDSTANGTYKSIQSIAPGAGVATITFEVDPGAVISVPYIVLRANS